MLVLGLFLQPVTNELQYPFGSLCVLLQDAQKQGFKSSLWVTWMLGMMQHKGNGLFTKMHLETNIDCIIYCV